MAKSVWRITLRQLESMIRLSEAMARLGCSAEVQSRHMQEAHRLLSKSIIRVETPDVDLDEDVEEEGVPNGEDVINEEGVVNKEGVVDRESVGDDMVNGGDLVNEEGVVNGHGVTNGILSPLPNGVGKEKDMEEEEMGVVKKPVAVVKRRVTYEEYRSIANLLILHLRHLEETGEGEGQEVIWRRQGKVRDRR